MSATILGNPPVKIYTGVDTIITAPITDYARSILNDVNATAARTTLGVSGSINLDQYSTFASALTSIGSTKTTLVINTAATVSTNTVIPSTLSIVVESPGIFNFTGGSSLTINGSFRAGIYQVFSGSGFPIFGSSSVTEVYPQWWGGVPDTAADMSSYINVAINTGKKVYISPGTWYCNLLIRDMVGVHIYGNYMNTILKAFAPATPIITIDSLAVQTIGTKIHDLRIHGGDASTAIYMAATTPWVVNESVIEDIYIEHCKKGIHIVSGSAAEEVYGNIFNNIYILHIPAGTAGNPNHGIYINKGCGNKFHYIGVANCGDYNFAIESWGSGCSFYHTAVDGVIRNSATACVWINTIVETIAGAHVPTSVEEVFRSDGERALIDTLTLVNIDTSICQYGLGVWGVENTINGVHLYGALVPLYSIILWPGSTGTLTDASAAIPGSMYSVYQAVSATTRLGWRISNAGETHENYITTLENNATPNVLCLTTVVTGGTTTITNFINGEPGQILRILSDHAITITDGTNIFLSGSANFVMAAGDTLTLIQKADGKWYELARGDN